jgi:hypothetical protein
MDINRNVRVFHSRYKWNEVIAQPGRRKRRVRGVLRWSPATCKTWESSVGVWGLAEKGHRYGLIEGVGEAATKGRGNGLRAARGWGGREGSSHVAESEWFHST